MSSPGREFTEYYKFDQDGTFAKRAKLPRTANTSRKELHTQARFDKERNIILPEHQVKLAEQGVDQDRTKDARPCSTDTIRLSIVCPSLWRKCEAANFPHTLKI